MESTVRKPFQGIINIIRFNWHYYVLAFIVVTALFFLQGVLPAPLNIVIQVAAWLAIAGMFISLIVSWYIYDYSALYSFSWLNNLPISTGSILVNIHAGFDESSVLLSEKYPASKLLVFDFYDAARHTEISIKRARKAYPAFPATQSISTGNIPLEENSVDYIFLILAAHEIREGEERVAFFKQLGKALANNGRIIVTEHQRDINNFLAYNIGFFHFFSAKTWKRSFTEAGLSIRSTLKITPFISNFILAKNGITS